MNTFGGTSSILRTPSKSDFALLPIVISVFNFNNQFRTMNHFYRQTLRMIFGAILFFFCVSLNAQTAKIQGQQARTGQIQAPKSSRTQAQVQLTPVQPPHAVLHSTSAQS